MLDVALLELRRCNTFRRVMYIRWESSRCILFVVRLQHLDIGNTFLRPCEDAYIAIRSSTNNIAIRKGCNAPDRDAGMEDRLGAYTVYSKEQNMLLVVSRTESDCCIDVTHLSTREQCGPLHLKRSRQWEVLPQSKQRMCVHQAPAVDHRCWTR